MADELAALDRRIAAAMVALRHARARSRHSANSETRWNEEMAERTLNGLLDRRPRHRMDERPQVMAVAAGGPGTEPAAS